MSYVVCDGCGYWHGQRDDDEPVKCPECGSEAAWAFSKIENALQYQHEFEYRVLFRFPPEFWDTREPSR